ncbi:TetR family transcriptional regulator [Microbacterium sp. X-17]|uniref:TetR family transcriptional regulator n=1 Tax=Microbacterium sp. X-17 TaxID=3144404 RepID=UPI0031F5923C
MAEERERDAELIAGVRTKDLPESEVGEFFGRAVRETLQHVPRELLAGPMTAVYHDDQGDHFEVTVGFPVSERPVDPSLDVVEIPAGRKMVETHRGDYVTLGEAYASLRAAVEERGGTLGVVCERYLVGPADDADSANWITELVTALPDPKKRGPRGPYAKTATTRKAILDAALEVFGQTGYHKGSLREISARIGISEAGVLHHFPSKRALLLATLEHRDEVAIRDVLPEARGEGSAWLHRLIDLVRFNMGQPGVVELYSTMSGEASNESHPAHEYFADRYARVLETMQEHLEAAGREGLLRPGVDPATAARQLTALLDGLQIQWLYDDGFDMTQPLTAYLDLVLAPAPQTD